MDALIIRDFYVRLQLFLTFFMLSKNKIKLIQSFDKKKFRTETGCFLAEGNKLISDILPFFECELLVCCSSWLATQGDIKAKELILAEQEEINKASLLKNPQQVIAVFRQPVYQLREENINNALSLVLDGIQDPGNLGTIIRVADWFGIENIICSPDTADVFNPKTVQASMGAIARVWVHYTPLADFIRSIPAKNGLPIYGTLLDGKNIYKEKLSANGLIVMGNEGNGISAEINSLITDKLYIPNYPEDRQTSESLNVATATAIVCAEFRRK